MVGEPNIHNIMGGMESTGGVRLHNHKRKLKQRYVKSMPRLAMRFSARGNAFIRH